jgi:hypothetical protein
MRRVYADSKTGIDPNKRFEQPAGFDDCQADATMLDGVKQTDNPDSDIEETFRRPAVDIDE